MKILYDTKELKKKITKENKKEIIEKILKFFSHKIGKKIIVTNAFDDDNLKFQLNIYSFYTKEEYVIRINNLLYNVSKWDVSIYKNNNKNHVEHYYIYDENKGRKVNDEFINENISIKKEMSYGTLKKQYTPYNLVKDNKRIHIVIGENDENLFKILLNLQSNNLIDIYKELESKNPKYVSDIFIEVANNYNEEKEKIITKDNKLVSYEKTYIKDDIKVILTYYGDHVSVTTNQKIDCENPLITKKVNVSNEIVMVKKLFK